MVSIVEDSMPEAESPRESLPRVNGAVALGTVICIKEEPESEEEHEERRHSKFHKALQRSRAATRELSAENDPSRDSSQPSSPSTLGEPAVEDQREDQAPALQPARPREKSKKSSSQEVLPDPSTSNNKDNSAISPTKQSRNRTPAKGMREEPGLLSSDANLQRAKEKQKESSPANKGKEAEFITGKEQEQEKSKEMRRSMTPTRAAEKRGTKRQSETSILSIADNLLRRMTQRTQKDVPSVTREPTPPSDEEPKQKKSKISEKPHEKSVESDELLSDDVPTEKGDLATENVSEVSASAVNTDNLRDARVPLQKERSPMQPKNIHAEKHVKSVQTTKKNISASPEASSQTAKKNISASPEASSQTAKKNISASPEGSSHVSVEQNEALKVSETPKKKKKEDKALQTSSTLIDTSLASSKQENLPREHKAASESTSPPPKENQHEPEKPPEASTKLENNTSKDTDQPPSKENIKEPGQQTPVKASTDKHSPKRSKKSTEGKYTRVDKEKVRAITKIALDLGYLRRSPRARSAKEEAVKVPEASSSHVSVEENEALKVIETPKKKQKKDKPLQTPSTLMDTKGNIDASSFKDKAKTAKRKITKESPIRAKTTNDDTKQVQAERKAVSASSANEDTTEKTKPSEEILAKDDEPEKNISIETVPKPDATQDSKGKKKRRRPPRKAMKLDDTPKHLTEVVVKKSKTATKDNKKKGKKDKGSTSGKASTALGIKEEGASKKVSTGKKESQTPKVNVVKAGQHEAPAIESIIVAVPEKGKKRGSKKKQEQKGIVVVPKQENVLNKAKEKALKSKQSSSASKVEDIYNKHVAALEGKMSRRGRSKKIPAQADGSSPKESPQKVRQFERTNAIVGRKAYKMWLQSQAQVVDNNQSSTMSRDEIDGIDSTDGQVRTPGKKPTQQEEMGNDKKESCENNDRGPLKVGANSGFPLFEGTVDEKHPKKKRSEIHFDLECSKCKHPMRNSQDFNVHVFCHAPDKRKLACPVCSQTFRNKNRCWGHVLRQHAGWKTFHSCQYCGKKYSRPDGVRVHIANAHQGTKKKDPSPKDPPSIKSNDKDDSDEDEDEEEFKDDEVVVDLMCKRCKRPIQNKSDCYTHILLHSPRGSRDNRRRVCPLCDKTAKDSCRIWDHVMMDHANIKPYQCDQCNTGFAREENLKKHQQTFHGKFLEPVAHARLDLVSDSWEVNMSASYYQHELQKPLKLSMGNVVSLMELCLNTLLLNQRKKVSMLSDSLGNQSIQEEDAGQNGDNETTEEQVSSEESKQKTESEEKTVVIKPENNSDGDYMKSQSDEEEEDLATITARKMIPKDCDTVELPCVLCPMGIKGIDPFKLHVLKHICDQSRVCPICRRSFCRKSSCRRHLVEHTFNWQHKCDLCTLTFPMLKDLAKHYTKHMEQSFQCLNCLARFSSEEELWQHIHPDKDLSMKDKPLGKNEYIKFPCRRVHVCVQCHQEFRSAWGLQYHQDNTHKDMKEEEKAQFVCCDCGKRFKSKITLRNHAEIHVQDVSYLCRHCGLTCRTKRQLQKHIEYKHLEKIYKCSYCPKMFATRSRLKEHAIMHQNKTFICDICGKVYRHQRVFETHCRQHIKPPIKKHRVFPCPQCNHQSKSKEQLNLHMRRHTGERPYKCSQCPKAFSSMTGVWRHQMSHAGTKPHSCHLCGKSFIQKCSLDRHLLSHAGIKPYKCEYCGAHYSQSYPLTKHMEKRHPDLPFVLLKKGDIPEVSAVVAKVTFANPVDQ